MLTRVVIVLLVVLNLGAGAWWALRPAPREMPIDSRVPGVAWIELASDRVMRVPAEAALATSVRPSASGSESANNAPVAAGLPAVEAPAATLSLQCATLGPFSTPALAQVAQARIAASGVTVSMRIASASGRGWRVLVPPLGDAAQAAAMATRIGAAGVSDYFVMRDGADANAIALGRYGSETAARRRAQSLMEAGFAARAEPVGAITHWLDIRSAGDAELADLRTRSGAPRLQSIDCTRLSSAAAG